MKFAKVVSMGKDADGKFVVETDDNSIMELPCDWVVEAIGQKSDMDWKSLTDADIVFAGDLASAKCSVIDAMASCADAAYEYGIAPAMFGGKISADVSETAFAAGDFSENVLVQMYEKLSELFDKQWASYSIIRNTIINKPPDCAEFDPVLPSAAWI